MSIDVTVLRDFYASPLGEVARRLVGRAIDAAWTNLRGSSVLGLGYAVPYLAGMRGGAGRVLAFMPAGQGVVHWPPHGRAASALVDPLTMPLADACIDRVLLVHALETVESPAELLHEVWRILAPGGRVVAVVPNRRGLWARIDATPFGHGQPFSRSQLRELMRRTHFSPERWTETLYTPPFRNRVLLRSAAAWDSAGAALRLPFAGLHVVDASKQPHRPIPVRARRRRATRRREILVPVPAARCRIPAD